MCHHYTCCQNGAGGETLRQPLLNTSHLAACRCTAANLKRCAPTRHEPAACVQEHTCPSKSSILPCQLLIAAVTHKQQCCSHSRATSSRCVIPFNWEQERRQGLGAHAVRCIAGQRSDTSDDQRCTWSRQARVAGHAAHVNLTSHCTASRCCKLQLCTLQQRSMLGMERQAHISHTISSPGRISPATSTAHNMQA